MNMVERSCPRPSNTNLIFGSERLAAVAMSNLFRSSRNRSTPGSKSATVGADDRAVCRIETGKGEGEGRGVEGRGRGGE